MKVKDSVVWVTGGTAGIGLACVKMLLSQGAKVMATARNSERGERVQSELNNENFMFVKADMIKTEELENALDAIIKKWGRIDVLIANAGGGGPSWTLPMKPTDASLASGGRWEWEYNPDDPTDVLEDFKNSVLLNLIGNFDVARQCAKKMMDNGVNEDGERGNIMFIASSTAFKRSSPGLLHGYCASKSGLVGLTKEMSVNLAQAGIRVNNISTGYFDTELAAASGFLSGDWLDGQIWPKTPGEPKYIAQMAVQIIENVFINNASLQVDAGYCGVPSY